MSIASFDLSEILIDWHCYLFDQIIDRAFVGYIIGKPNSVW